MGNKQFKYNLPESWVWAAIEELGTVVGGGTPSTKESQFWGGDIAWITPADLSDYKGKYIIKGERNISQLGLDYSSATLLPKGSLLFSSRAPIGYIAIAQNDLATSQGFKSLIPTTFTNVDYLFYYLLYAKPSITEMASGTTFLELSAAKFRKIPIALAPLNEQCRIVEIIEELFSEIDHVEISLYNIKKSLDFYWQTILHSSFCGNLSQEWRVEEINNSLKSLNSIYEIPTGWEWVELGSHTDFIGAGSTPKGGRSIYAHTGIPFIRSQNVLHYSLHLDDVVYITNEINEKMSRTQTQINDVLLNITGASIGRCAYIPDSLAQANVNQHVCIIRTKSTLLYKYLSLYLNSPAIQRLIQEWSSGATREALTLSQIRCIRIPIPICSLKEQEFIVSELESQHTVLEHIRGTLEKKIDQIQLLKQSVLNKAFEGRLVPQNPNDEPASELLKRIKVERVEFSQNKPKEKKVKVKIKKMERTKSVFDLLKEAQKPVSAKEVWLQSKHWESIDDFYAELKSISDSIEQTKSKTEILLSLKK